MDYKSSALCVDVATIRAVKTILFHFNLYFICSVVDIYLFSSTETIIDLQRTILSACFLKQPGLFGEILQKYIDLIDIMASANVSNRSPLTINLFCENDFDISTIVSQCTYKTVQISDSATLTNFIVMTVRVLGHILPETHHFENNLTIKACKSILNIFKAASPGVSLKCIRCFTKIGRRSSVLADLKIDASIIEGLVNIERQLQKSVNDESRPMTEICEFIDIVHDSIDTTTTQTDQSRLRLLINACLAVILAHSKLKVSQVDIVIQSIYKLLKTLANQAHDRYSSLAIYEMIRSVKCDADDFSQAVELMVYVIQSPHADISNPWSIIDKQLEHFFANELNESQLRCINSIFKTAKSVEQKIKIFRQKEETEKETETNEDIQSKLFAVDNEAVAIAGRSRLFTNIDEMTRTILRNIIRILEAPSTSVEPSTLFLISELSTTILSLQECNEIDDCKQHQLVLFALSPFLKASELLHNHFESTFDTATPKIIRTIERFDSSTSSWKTDALKILHSFELKNLSAQNKTYFVDIVTQICQQIINNDNCDEINQLTMNFAIQDSQAIDLFEGIFKSLISTPSSSSIRWRQMICLFAHKCFLIKTFRHKSNGFKIVCQLCDLKWEKCDTNTRNGKFYSNLINEHNGRIVSVPKLSSDFLSKIQSQLKRSFQSFEYPIRLNMTHCIPALLNHVPEFSREKDFIDAWLSPLLDDRLEVRLCMAKQLNNIPWNPKVASDSQQRTILELCCEKLLQAMKKFLLGGNEADQSSVLELILSVATAKDISERFLFCCFRLLLYFCVSYKSAVSRKACLYATEICYTFNVTPKNLLVWYRNDILRLIVPLGISNYSKQKISLERSFDAVSHMVDSKHNFRLMKICIVF